MKIFQPAVLFLCMLVSLRAETYDLVIRHGRIVDGSGNPAFFGDVGVKEGKIAAIGRVSGDAKSEVDAKGLIVAPGFIDVHTHADEVAEMPLAENFLRMGVTTIVVGNCGSSALNVGKFFSEIESNRVSPNVATLIGHNTVRGKAMGGSFMRPPNDAELDKMRGYVRQAMEDGAVGLSTGLIYLPGTFAKTEEIIELAKVASQFDGIYASHQRHEDKRIFESMEEIFRIAREANIRAEISHIKLSGPAAWGQTDKVFAMIEKARAEGLDVTEDQYAYTASSTGISQLIPDSAFDGGKEKFRERLDDPKAKAKIIEQMKSSLAASKRKDFSYAVIASYRHDKSLNGKNIVEAAKLKRGIRGYESGFHPKSPFTGKAYVPMADQVEMILEIEKNGGATGVFHGMDENDLQIFMRYPNTMIACDSGLREFGKDVPHPRGYGNNARVLGRYVRDLKVLRMEDAIRKMSSLPANTFQLKNRGQLREGNWADIVIFDPEKVQDKSTYNDPHHYPAGIPHVFVNGIAVIKDGEETKAKPGMALRHKAN